MARSALLLAAALLAAPTAALAEDNTAEKPAEPAAAPAEKAEAQPAWNPGAASGVVLAIYKRWTVQAAAPKLMRTDAPADGSVPKVEIQGKDAWAEEYGMKVAFNKVSYRARF